MTVQAGVRRVELVLERFYQARHSDEHGYALLVYCADHLGGIERVQKHGRTAQNLREKNSEKLAEYMAEWKKIEKSQWMKEAFPAAIAVDFFFEGFEDGEQVAVVEDDAARFRRGAGGEDDLYEIGSSNWRR